MLSNTTRLNLTHILGIALTLAAGLVIGLTPATYAADRLTPTATVIKVIPGQANLFYERAIGEHIQIGIAAAELLRGEGARLHSRKLRAFNEPPFR